MVKLEFKRRGKPANGTVRIGFRFGLGEPDNPTSNLKSRKENRRKNLSCFLFMRLDGVRERRAESTLGEPENIRMEKTVYKRDACYAAVWMNSNV